MGRRAIADAFKTLQGTDQPVRMRGDKADPAEVITLMPPRPEWLKDKWAIDEWNRLGPILLHAGLLTRGNVNAFAQLCAVHGAMATTYEAGGIPIASQIGAYRNLIVEFGLTPASAAKVRAPDPTKDRGNAFARNGKPDR
jgi:phage terminase small subunit